MSSDSESNSFANLSRSSDEDIMLLPLFLCGFDTCSFLSNYFVIRTFRTFVLFEKNTKDSA